ncbi:hypothetical protein BKA59DRAFT_473277 [Fusarium tricinctum]|uniref:Hydrophobin n=1 Tax=Fusarium tricinctum TaxID=61284 RepID=A0A8K0S4X0_9HYPO|nr:hypothetical protein BKA59DRAFT_473277 [Fusarium tricinctum]
MFPINHLIILFTATAFALPGDQAGCVTEPPTTTPTPEQTFDCDYSYCDESGISWCFYFVPFTTINPTLGPMPGETRVYIGTCGPAIVAPAPAY